MLNKIANFCTRVLLERKMISDNKKSIFIYGFELFFSTVFTVIVMAFIGIRLKMWEETCLFLLFFIPIRMVAGGYHANTYRNCFVLTNFIFILYLFICTSLKDAVEKNISVVGFAFSLIYIGVNSPIVSSKHPVSDKRKNKNRLWTYKVLTLESLCIAILYFFDKKELIFAAMITTLLVALMMAAAGKEGKRNG